ncbi:MAG: hypothetical protein IPP22_08555 [Nitrosomonas sp.]|nr:hypothetical protein [Nitrosomonas sp.]
MTVLEHQTGGEKQKTVNANKGTKCAKCTKRTKRTKREKRLRVPVLPEEEMMIKAKASESGLTIAEYLRNLGFWVIPYPVLSITGR